MSPPPDPPPSDPPSSDPPPNALPEAYGSALADAMLALLEALTRIEHGMRQMQPDRFAELAPPLAESQRMLDRALPPLRDSTPPAGLERFHDRVVLAVGQGLEAVTGLCNPDLTRGIGALLEAMAAATRCQETLYPLRRAMPPVAQFFVEPALRPHAHTAALEPEAPQTEGGTDSETAAGRPRTGLFNSNPNDDPNQRGGFSFYVPETYDGSRDWPLVVALHGATGTGRGFLWSWLREAKSRECLLLAPTSRGSTWSFMGPDIDGRSLRSMIEWICERWRVDRTRVLLTGLSDGATYALLTGLAEDAPFTHLAPFSGVLHPHNFANGNLERAAQRPVFLVHGTLDWMFPIAIARAAAAELEKAGARLVWREVEDLSHTYARELNAEVLDWLGAPIAIAGSAVPPATKSG